MYPTLYHLIKDIFGAELNGLRFVNMFGLMVAVAFILGNICFTLELKRKEAQGLLSALKEKVLKGAPASASELLVSGILGFIIGFKGFYLFSHYDEALSDTQAFILSFKGSGLGGVLVAAVFIYITYRDKQKQKLPNPEWVEVEVHPYEHVGNMTIIAAISGLLGAKIFHNLENMDQFLNDPVDALISFSGLTMYGGLILGSLSVIYYARKKKINTLHLIDACAPGLMLAYAIGRIGCQLAGDGDWGINNTLPQPAFLSFLPDWFWAYNYPNNVVNEGIPIPGCMENKYCSALEVPVFPTPLYEVIACGLLFGVLWMIRKKVQIPGVLFSIYLILNGVERFFIEKIRINTEYPIFGGITQATLIAVLLVVVGIAGIFYFRKLHTKKNAPA